MTTRKRHEHVIMNLIELELLLWASPEPLLIWFEQFTLRVRTLKLVVLRAKWVRIYFSCQTVVVDVATFHRWHLNDSGCVTWSCTGREFRNVFVVVADADENRELCEVQGRRGWAELEHWPIAHDRGMLFLLSHFRFFLIHRMTCDSSWFAEISNEPSNRDFSIRT